MTEDANTFTPKKLNATGSRCREHFYPQKIKCEIDPAVIEIDRRRAALGISHRTLCRRAVVSLQAWKYLRTGHTRFAQRETLQRLRAGLQGQRRAAKAGGVPPVVALSLYNAAFTLVCMRRRLNPAEMRAQNVSANATANARWRAAADVRRIAIYLVNCGLGVPQFVVARALGITPAAVCIALREVEARRDKAGFDAFLERCEALLTARGYGGDA